MKRIEAAFLASVYGLTGVAGLMLAFSEGSAFPQILTPPLAVLAYLLTDRTRLLHLPLWWANGLGVAAFLLAGYQMYDNTTEGRLLAGAHLVVYLTWIVLFQEKRLTQYWWLLALAVPQVAVGAILTIASSYGGMLVAFMVAAIWTLSLFSLYQAQLQYGDSGGADDDAEKERLAVRTANGARWGAKRTAPARPLFLRPSAARGTIQLDPDERWLGFRFVVSMLAVSAAALVVAAGFFLFIPRLWAGRNEWGSNDTRQFRIAGMTGFTSEVRLGDMVPLLENPQRVLQVSLFAADGAPMDVAEYCAEIGYAEPLFRGSTMESYEDGAWSGGRQTNLIAAPTHPASDSVRQQILMEPLGTPCLFAIQPINAVHLANTQELAEYHSVTSQIYRPEGIPADKAISYDVYSPAPDAAEDGSLGGMNDWYYRAYLQIDEKKLPRLVELARRLTGYDPKLAERPGHEPDRQARRRMIGLLSNYLRDSGIYRYSLDTAIKDPTIDPIEDFLVNRKAGHCEYFASALTLMLRAVGIPSRLVSGFKGGGVNAISGVFEVEQRHAHVWVEAYFQGKDRRIVGPWITIDPTPEAREKSVEGFASRLGTAHELASVVSSTWSRIINLDIAQQQTAFYTPFVDYVKDWWSPANGSRPFLAVFIFGLVDFATDPTQWFTLRGLVTVTLCWTAIAAVVLLVRMRKRIWQRLGTVWKRRSASMKSRIAFYERFEKVCAEMGLTRSAAQTQREFGGTVGPRIRQIMVSADGLPEFPPRLVELFYRARFGDEDLSQSVIEDINRHLETLEGAVRSPSRKTSPA